MASVTMAAQAICVPSSVAATVPHSHLSSVRIASPLTMPAVAPLRLSRRLHIVAASSTKPDLASQVEQSIKEAQEVCAGDEASGECAAAWDEVEELSAATAHKRVAEKATNDPLEIFCKDNPETDECRVYED